MIAPVLILSMLVGSAPDGRSLAVTADRLYKEGQFVEAAATLTQAWELERVPLYLYNIARAWERADRSSNAVLRYEQYIALPAAETDAALVQKAKQALARLQVKPSFLTRTVTLIKTEPHARSAAIAAGVSLIACGGSIGFALAASQARYDFAHAATLAEKRRLERDTRTFALVADLALVAGVGGAVTSAVLAAFVPQATGAALTLGVTAQTSGVGLNAAGRF